MNIQRPPSRQPMPPHAKRVFKGVIFEVWQWQQEMFDGSLATFEKIVRPDTAQVVPVLEDGRIIVLEQEQPARGRFTSVIAGRIEADEPPEQAAARELKEESGYGSDEVELLKAVQPVSKIDWTVYTFIARNCRRVAEPSPDAGEKIKLKLVSFDEFIEIVLGQDFYDLELVTYVLRTLREPDGRMALRRKILGR